MDIAVTIPKKEYNNDDLETEYLTKYNGYQFWTMSRIPRKLKEGDRVYFVRENRIESSMKVFYIKYDTIEICEVTRRAWTGKCILCLCDLRKENINLSVKGFQGFRYKWWEN